jgi:hypothetical protein
MKTNVMKIFAIASIMIFIGAGSSMADGWKAGNHIPPGHAYGHYKAPVHFGRERHYYPVVVERRYYHEPVRYIAPAPNGYFFGMSVMEPGVAFSFGASAR